MQIFSTPLLFPQLTRLMTNKQVSYVTGYIYAFLLLLNPLAALANRSHVIWQWIVILFSYGFAQCFRFFFVTYPCQQRVLSLVPRYASFIPRTAWCSSPTAPIRTSAPKSTDSAKSCPPSAALWYALFFSSPLTPRAPRCAPTSSRGRTRTDWASRSTTDARSMWEARERGQL